MATHKSAEKRARQSVRKTARNSQTKGAVRTFEKRVRTAIATGDAKSAGELLVAFQSKIGKAAAKGVINAKAVARKVGRLSAHVSKLAAGVASGENVPAARTVKVAKSKAPKSPGAKVSGKPSGSKSGAKPGAKSGAKSATKGA